MKFNIFNHQWFYNLIEEQLQSIRSWNLGLQCIGSFSFCDTFVIRKANNVCKRLK